MLRQILVLIRTFLGSSTCDRTGWINRLALHDQCSLPTLTRLSAHKIRVSVLLLLGAWLVHQLRYLVALGPESAEHAASHGHAYLSISGPVLICAVALALLSWFFSLKPVTERTEAAPFGSTWIRMSLLLAAIFAFQEASEAVSSTHHPQMMDAIFGSGGWISIPLSFLVGAAISLALAGARAARAAIARTLSVRVSRCGDQVVAAARPPWAEFRKLPILATNLAGRAPPVVN